MAQLAKMRHGLLVQFRESRGLTQQAAADLAGASVHDWNRIECLDFRGACAPAVMAIAALVDAHEEEIVPSGLVRKRLGLSRTVYTDVDPARLLQANLSEQRHILPSPELEVSIADAVKSAMTVLTERQRQVVERRFGLDGRACAALEECAVELGTSRERVRQIQISALRKMARNSTLERDVLELLAEADAQK